MNEEKAYAYWLTNVAGLTAKSRKSLLHMAETYKNVYELSEKNIVLTLGKEQSQVFFKGKECWDVRDAYEKLTSLGIQYTARGLSDYPKRLEHIGSPPAALYYKGRLPLHQKPSVAIVGARMCSEYGKLAAEEFGSKLALAGIQIISGLAVGIDGISQKAALDVGAESFGVLGCGVDICYPKCNQLLYDRMCMQGGILSEFPPGTPKAQHFPARNRIISGLADLVLVVEAKERSGTGITVDFALEQGRDVYAVPGRITDALSQGCHKLIRQGAGIAATPEDILSVLYYEEKALQAGKSKYQKTGKKSVILSLNAEERSVWDCLDELPKGLQDIHDRRKQYLEEHSDAGKMRTKSCMIQETMEVLMGLCVKGFVENENNGYRKKRDFL